MKHYEKDMKRRLCAWVMTVVLIASSLITAWPASALGTMRRLPENNAGSAGAYLRLSDMLLADADASNAGDAMPENPQLTLQPEADVTAPAQEPSVTPAPDAVAPEATPEGSDAQATETPAVDAPDQPTPEAEPDNTAAPATQTPEVPDTEPNDPAIDEVQPFTHGYAVVDKKTVVYRKASKNGLPLGKVTGQDAVVWVTDRLGDGESESDWLRVAFFTQEKDVYVMGYLQVKSVTPLSDAESDAYVAHHAGQPGVAYVGGNVSQPLAPIGFAWHEETDPVAPETTVEPEATTAPETTVEPEATAAPEDIITPEEIIPETDESLEDGLSPDEASGDLEEETLDDLHVSIQASDEAIAKGALEPYANDTTNFDVYVEWDDSDSSARPENITLNLMQNGQPFRSATVEGMDSYWYHTFTDLPVQDDNGKDYLYSVTQDPVAGYTTGYSLDPSIHYLRILNTKAATVDIEAQVLWLDDAPADRPESVTLVLKEYDYYIVEAVTVTAANGWKHTFSGLPAIKWGGVVGYSITQNSVPGYTTATVLDLAKGSATISNRKGETSDITVTKVWDDNDHPDRPDSAYVYIQSNASWDDAILNEDNNWTHTFTVQKYASDGVTENVPTVREADMAGYQANYAVDAQGNITITNTLLDMVEITVQKKWDDNNNPDRPQEVYAQLTNGHYGVASAVLNEDNQWSHTFKVSKYYNGTSIPCQYTVTEYYTAGYQPEITVDGITGVYTITNVPREKINVTITKQWDDNQNPNRPDHVTAWLLGDGQYLESVELSSANNWSHTFLVNKVRDSYQGDIVYTAFEEDVDGYDTVYSVDASNHILTITNKLREQVDIEVTKVWDDGNDPQRPDSVTVSLWDGSTKLDSAELNAANGWRHTFTAFKYPKNGTTPISYTIMEDAVERYYPTYETDTGTGKVTVINRLRELTTRTVTKVWDDADSPNRPTSVSVNLLADGALFGSAVLDAANGWSHTFTAYRYQMDNQTETVFSVLENPVAGYQRSYSTDDVTGNLIVTNKLLDNGLIDIALSAGQNFRVRYADNADNTTIVLTYKPYIPGQNSSVTLYLPPAFGLSAIPPNTDDYTVTTATVPLPERYYDEADSDILKGYNSSVTKVTAVTFHYNASVNGQSITTLPIRVNQYSNLSALMVAYGADAANIPLKIIAEAQDEAGNVLDWDILAGTSRITNADGSAEYHSELILGAANSTLDFTSGNYNIQNPTINSSSTYVYNLYEWHYPVTDLVMYLPWPEDVTLKNNPYYSLAAPLDAVYLDTDGDGVPDKRYLKTTTRQLPLINTNYSQYFQASAVLPDQDTLYPGDVFAFGDVFVDYTFLGQTYQQVKMTKLGNHIVRAYKEASFTFGFWNEGWYVDLPSARRRLQGKAGDRYLIGLNNYQSTNPTYVYEDATVTLDFPYEVSPTAISQTAGSGVSGNNGPNAVTYFVHGDSTEYTLPITQGQLQFQFPDNAEHITKVKFHYDVIESASSMNYLIVANNSTTDEQNIALPEEQPVIFNASLTTANGLRTALWEGLDAEKTSNLRDPIYSAFTCESSQRFTLIGLPDALRFGTGLKSPSYSDGNYRTHIAARGQTDGHYNISSYVTPWNIALMKSDSQMKDYQDVTITIAPVGAEDAKALSKLRGFTIPLIPGTHVDQRVLTFATNKHPGGRTVTGNHTGTWVGLELDVDEYVTGPVQLSLGTLYGSSMNATTEVSFGKTSSASGEVWSSWTNDYSIVPAFNGSRYYFDEGVPNSTPVSSSDVHKLVATINTSSVAKFINGTQAPTNSTSTGTITYDTQWSTTIYNSANATVTSWNNTARQYYQGGTISFSVNNNVQAVDQILYAAASGTVSSYPFNHANLLLYLEVAPDFTLQNVSNHQLMEIRPLANGNKLYVYKRNTFSGAYGYAVAYGSFTVQAYVHPDAQLNTVGTPVIVNAGFSWDGFANENMMPSTGTDAYYNRVPHYNLSISERAFPSAWGIADAPQFNDLYGGVENQLAFAIDTNVKIQLALQDKVIIRPVVDGVMYVSQGQFYDHNKTNLAARAYLSNTAIADLPEYEAVFVLPREGGTTTGVNTEGGMYDYPDEFNLYLTGPVQFNGAPDNLNITYWDANGQQVAVSQTSSEAELRSVVEIRVYFKNFAPLDTYSMEFPLETDYVKRGTQTQDLASYIGVKRRYAESPNVSIDTVDFQYSVPAKFVFASYDLTSYVRLDMAETGYANSALSGVATVTVFYRDGAAAEQTLYTSSSGYMHSLKVNADVTRITATIHPDQTTKYGFTIQNAAGVSETYDSDLPRVQPNEVSSLDVDLEDLILKRADRYNVGLYRLPGVTGSHHVVRMGDTAQAVATVSGSASASVLAQYQNVFLPDSTDDSVATITAAGVITGVAVGTTTYTVKTTNTIGQNPVYAFASDTTTGTGTIHVVPNMEVAVRLFYDSNFNGVYDAGEVVVTDPDVYLANANTTTRLVDGGTSAGDGYTYMDVPDATSYYIHAINPGSTNILDADAHRFADAIGLLDGQGDALGYSPAQSGYGRAYQHYDFANYLNNFNDPDFDRSNMTVYMDFALQAPHTVTFTAEHGNVSGGTLTAAAEANGFVAVGGSVVQQDPANRTFLQQKYWHGAPLVSTPANPNVQQYLDSAAEVTPDTHYAWSAARDGRDWKHAQQDEIRTEEQWWSLGTRVLSDMTLIALPKQSSFQVTYQPNLDAATGSVTDDHRYAYNDEVTVKQNEFAHPHYSFTGWNMQQDGSGALYQENDTFNITADTVLYAMWNPQYRIEHYLQRSDGSSYEIKPDATQLLYAPVGSTVTATPLAFAGYLYNAAISTESGMVVDVQGDAGTGITQLVLKLYYDAQPELSIQKTTQQKVVRAEDGIVYTVVVSNTGKGDAKNVRVDEVYPAYIDIATFTPVHGYMDTDTWVIDSIAAGETAMLNVVITLKNDVPDGEMIVNKVLISEVDGKKPTEEISDTEESIVANPKLTIEKTTTQSTVGAGEDINYTITLTNQGTGEARQIIVQEIIPGNATFKTSATSHGTYDEVTHQWRAGTLAAGQSASLSITLTVHADAQDGHRVHNVVEIAKENGTKPDEPPKADAITTVQNPMVLIQKTALQSSVRAGDEITYEIKVTNPRTTEILDVKVQEVLPANVTLQRYMAHQGTYTPANHYWQVGALAANGGSATLTLVVKVDPNAADGNITNQASITEFHPADGVIQQGGPSDTATVLIRNPQLQIEKSSPVPNGSILSSQGGLLYYQIDVRNTGLGKAQHVAVSDAIPANTTLASASSSVPAQITTSATSVRFEIDEIAPGQVVTLSMAVNVSAWEKIGTRTISNTAVLHFQGESVQSNTVVHRQTNTRQVDVPKMGDANQETHLVIMMVMLLAAAVLLRTASYLVRAKAQRDQENKR